MTDMSGPEAFISSQPPGCAAYAWGRQPGNQEEVMWLIRETTERIANLGSPLIEFRFAVLQDESMPERFATVMPILTRIGEEKPENIFETWFNYCARDTGDRFLLSLSQQPRIVLCFYGENKRCERKIEVVNSWANSFMQARLYYRANTGTYGGWLMRDFDAVKDVLQRRYSIMDLWQMMQDEKI